MVDALLTLKIIHYTRIMRNFYKIDCTEGYRWELPKLLNGSLRKRMNQYATCVARS